MKTTFIVFSGIMSEMFEVFQYSTLVLEALSFFLFGWAWLIKGRALGMKEKLEKAFTGSTMLRKQKRRSKIKIEPEFIFEV